MSTISSYFGRTRKSTQNNELNHSAVRAPEPVNEPVKKTLIKQKQKKANKTSILYYLTPQTTTTPEETEVNEEVKIVEEKSNRDDDLDEDEHVVCKIRHMKPFSSIWETILDEYDDPSAHMYPLPDARFIKKELYIKNMEIPDPLQNKRRFNECEELPESSDDETVKNVRIRKTTPFKLPKIEDYDDDEYLRRPLRFKHTLQEANKIMMYMTNEFLSAADESLFQID